MPEDKYYNDTPEDERLNEEAEGAEVVDEAYEDQAAEEEDTDLDRLLDFLVETVTSAPSVPITNKKMVSPQVIMDIVEDIRNCLPDEVRYSAEILKKRDRILRDAQNTADSKTQAAEARANAAPVSNGSDGKRLAVSHVEDVGLKKTYRDTQKGGVFFDLPAIFRVIARIHDKINGGKRDLAYPFKHLEQLRHQHGIFTA